MYSLRYGTVPVVRATGGLDDTIGEDTGFQFVEYSGTALLDAVRSADRAFGRPGCLARHDAARRMAQDYSWGSSAARYSALLPAVGSRADVNPLAEKTF